MRGDPPWQGYWPLRSQKADAELRYNEQHPEGQGPFRVLRIMFSAVGLNTLVVDGTVEEQGHGWYRLHAPLVRRSCDEGNVEIYSVTDSTED